MSDNYAPEIRRLQEAVGCAITKWSMVEAALLQIFHNSIFQVVVWPMLATPQQFANEKSSSAIFYAVESFRAKLEIVDAAVTAILKEPEAPVLLARWRKLYDKSRKLSLKRNRLAHWMIVVEPDSKSGAVILAPSLFGPAYEEALSANKVMNASMIGHLNVAFTLLSVRCFDYANELAGSEELRRIFDAQKADLTECLRLRDQTRAAPLGPPPPSQAIPQTR